MGGHVKSYLKDKGVKIQASPPYQQSQNGLVKRHWQTIVSMARNWLRSALLPAKYWFFAVKRACEVTNLLPIRHGKTITMSHEVVHGTKADFLDLFPLFSTAYIKQLRDTSEIGGKWKTQTLKCIAVGQCSKSDSLIFYHPPSKQTITCGIGYKFDTFSQLAHSSTRSMMENSSITFEAPQKPSTAHLCMKPTQSNI